ncbi:glutamate receptor 2-like [Physella acuta]|uniref:glutamate receptor 2-like n=1 Tax=Physella acuta TaxID=109671 RepID=UPI0027DCBB7B|nr:glutamate receptor 2-like [Physella acuta]
MNIATKFSVFTVFPEIVSIAQSTNKAVTLISSPLSEKSPDTIWSELTTAAGHVYLRQSQDSNGSLARRETALTTLPMSRNENRRTRINFSSLPIMFEDVQITYRLPEEKDHLDLTYINIFKPDIYLYLTGAILGVGILGAIIHLISSLTTLTDLFFFRTESIRNVQSGLIIWTSWAIFCFILNAAYSANLVTTFTVKTPELTIKTLQDLLNQKEFTIGINQHGNALQTFLMSSQDPIHKQIWKRILQQTKTNPRFLNMSIDDHKKKLLTEKYAWIHHTALVIFPHETYPDVRTYVQSGFEEIRPSCIATPQNVFYSQALNTTLLYLEEAGILEKLRMTYIHKNKTPRVTSKVSDNQAVTLHRIELPVYCVMAGIGFAALILIFEVILFQYRKRKCP